MYISKRPLCWKRCLLDRLYIYPIRHQDKNPLGIELENNIKVFEMINKDIFVNLLYNIYICFIKYDRLIDERTDEQTRTDGRKDGWMD